MLSDDDSDRILLSALNHFAYCPRRCFLIHGEGEFEDNAHTLSGVFEHRRADEAEVESRPGVRIERALPVWSDRLGLSGRCDVVEFHDEGVVFPVEYKHGRRQSWLNDDLQLAAQALCLEEMLGRTIPRGAIYHQQSRRRREVEITPELRRAVEETATAIHRLLEQDKLPPPTDNSARCRECSLQTTCRPSLARVEDEISRRAEELFRPEEEP